MAVFVDDMYREPMGQYRRMKMSHMLADTDDELHAMADKIGVARKWFQKPGTPGRHYDIAICKRKLAVAAGAVEITLRQASAMCAHRRVFGTLGTPDGALAWRRGEAQKPGEADA